MALRVTPQLFISQTLRNAQSHSAALVRLQEQIASGVRIHRPSDDPAAVRRLLAQQSQDGRLETQLANIQDVRGRLNLSVSQLLEAKSLLVSAKSIALEGNQEFESREHLALEVETLIDRMLALANTENDGRYVFGGTANQSPPFLVDKSSGRITGVQYTGSDSRSDVVVAPNVTADVYYAGSEVFQPSSRDTTLFLGNTGAASGSGTDSGVGQGTLLVRHTATTYAAGSGVQVGTSSPAGDTVIGAAGSHLLTIDDTSGTGASGTISLNGGPVISFSNTDTDLEVIGLSGEVVFVDTTSITAGFSGDIAMTADGSLST
ncbi:MAG: flagellar hook-associated protein FlgL, partial [Pirellulales bacterium]